MVNIIIYATLTCPYCTMAKQLLEAKGVSYTEISVSDDPHLRAEMEAKSGRKTVPQIFIGEQHIGGFDDLSALDAKGKLDPLLCQSGNNQFC